MTPNGTLARRHLRSVVPTFLLFPDAAGQWHLCHGNGTPLFEGQNLSYETLLSLAKETGAAYKILDPKQRTQEKGAP